MLIWASQVSPKPTHISIEGVHPDVTSEKVGVYIQQV
jgi:hypothetical protein